MSKRTRDQCKRAFAGEKSLNESSAAHSGSPSDQAPAENASLKTEASYWRQRLFVRRYQFPASGQAEHDLAAQIDYNGVGYYFPLGTADLDLAAAKACRIDQTVSKRGWSVACEHFSRELIVSFEWCTNPVLWTYTTIHTLVEKTLAPNPLPVDSNRQRVLVVEADEGIRRALCWSINQQAGFESIPCESAEAFAGAFAMHKPHLVLLDHTLAGRLGSKSAGTIAAIPAGVTALTYSVHADGDRMFMSTPGGASGYLVKRVKPDRLLEPILGAMSRSEFMTEDLLLRVKYYFQELLQLHSSHDNLVLAKLTPREREVLGLLSKGCVDKEIAQAMGISVWTVHGYIKSIFERLHVRTRTEAVIRYLEK